MFPSRRIVTSGGDVFRDEYSLSFDGSNANIRIPEVEYDVDGSTVSFVFWGKRAAVDTTLTVLGHTSETSLKLIRFNSANQLKITTDTVGDTGTITQNINDTEWHHYVVIASSGAITAYQDGVACSVSGNVGDNNLTINTIAGQGTNGTDNEFNGNISEIAVYNIALTSAQAKQIYNGREPFNHKDWSKSGNLTQWWRFGDGPDDGNGDTLTQLVLDVADTTTGTVITPSMSDNASMDGSNWTGAAANEWTITTNTATSFGAITDTDFASGAATVYNYMSGANSTVDANLPLGAYKITGTLATAGTLPANTSALVWDSDTPRTHAITAGDFTIYEVADSVSGNHMFKFVANAEGQSFTLSNVEITPINGNAAVVLGMATSDFKEDSP